MIPAEPTTPVLSDSDVPVSAFKPDSSDGTSVEAEEHNSEIEDLVDEEEERYYDEQNDYENEIDDDEQRAASRWHAYRHTLTHQYDGKLILVVGEDGSVKTSSDTVHLQSRFFEDYAALPHASGCDESWRLQKRAGKDLCLCVPDEHFRYALPFKRDTDYGELLVFDLASQLIKLLRRHGWDETKIEKFMHLRLPKVPEEGWGIHLSSHQRYIEFHWSARHDVPDLRKETFYFRREPLKLIGHGVMIEHGYASIVVDGLISSTDLREFFTAIQGHLKDHAEILEIWERQVIVENIVLSRRQLQLPFRVKSLPKKYDKETSSHFKFQGRTMSYKFELPNNVHLTFGRRF